MVGQWIVAHPLVVEAVYDQVMGEVGTVEEVLGSVEWEDDGGRLGFNQAVVLLPVVRA